MHDWNGACRRYGLHLYGKLLIWVSWWRPSEIRFHMPIIALAFYLSHAIHFNNIIMTITELYKCLIGWLSRRCIDKRPGILLYASPIYMPSLVRPTMFLILILFISRYLAMSRGRFAEFVWFISTPALLIASLFFILFFSFRHNIGFLIAARRKLIDACQSGEGRLGIVSR